MNNNFLNTLLEDFEEKDLIINAVSFIKTFFNGESSGHDFYHSIRVFRTAHNWWCFI